ncbi:MAG: SAM-dependent methyltransferase [Prevotellaceae bacterium]|nr:SAM-dependent methyltransferase [Prevotellaceae bacterium]
MGANFFYDKLGYELTDSSQITAFHSGYRGLEKIGIDKVYFSGDFPAVLFKEVNSFNEQELQEVAEIQKKVWNYRKVMLLFVVSEMEIRIYNCYEKPEYLSPNVVMAVELAQYEIFRAHRNEKSKMEILLELFSQIGVDCGSIWTSKHNIREKVNIQKRIDNYLLQSLVKTAEALSPDIKNREIIHALLLRSIFILYLEDSGAAKEAGIYGQIREGAQTYFDILDDVEDTYKLFNKLHEHFENIFPEIEGEQNFVTNEHLKKISKCFAGGYLSESHVSPREWRIFDFNFIQTELLSEVYENFLGEFESGNVKGQFYTPYPVVELMLNDKLPSKNETDYAVKILDISCSSGIFLVESYKRLIQRWRNANPNGIISFEKLRDILLDNIFGIEIDPLAIKVASFNLYMTLIEQLDPGTLWVEKGHQLPPLINNPDEPPIHGKQGKNLWCGDTVGGIDAGNFEKADLLTGNPPFGTDKISPEIRNYLDERKYAQEKVLAFLDKAVQFVKDDGKIAMIFNTKVLTNTNKNYRNFRKWLFNKTYVEKVYNLSIFKRTRKDFGGQLFHSSTVPVSIVYYQKSFPGQISDTIEYYAPKTYVRSNIVDGLIIDDDVKFLSRNECQKPDTKIWKIAMWGNFHDFSLLAWLNCRSETDLKSYFSHNKWIHGSGLNGDSKHRDFVPSPIIETKAITKYYTPETAAVINSNRYRKIDERLFKPPFIVVEKGQKGKQIAASYIDYPAYLKSGVFVMNNSDDSSQDVKKVLVSLLNSDLVSYYLFLSSSSWGIERGQVFFNEYLELPVFSYDIKDIYFIVSIFDELIEELKHDLSSPEIIRQKEKEINRKLESVIGLTEKEQILVQDMLNFSLDLFEKGENSLGFQRTSKDENKAYADMICDEINNSLKHSMVKVCATIYEVQPQDPLNLVVLSFSNRTKKPVVKSEHELNNVLSMLNDYSLWQKGQSIYVRKQYRYYDDNTIYLIKPNQKRFWTRSQAMDDATSLAGEISNMKNQVNIQF